MNKWWRCLVSCLVLLSVSIGVGVRASHAENVSEEALETVWDYQNPEHREALESLAYEHIDQIRKSSKEYNKSYAEVMAYGTFMANVCQHLRLVKEEGWKMQFLIFADISELSPAYFGGPLKIKDRVEKESSEGFFSNLFRRTWDYSSPEDREELVELIYQQEQEEQKQFEERLLQSGLNIKGNTSANLVYFPTILKHAVLSVAQSIIQIESSNGEEIFHGEDEAWLLFFTMTESISYWTKEFYGMSSLGTEIVLK